MIRWPSDPALIGYGLLDLLEDLAVRTAELVPLDALADWPVADPGPPPNEIVARDEAEQLVARALAVLDPRDRALISLRFGLAGGEPWPVARLARTAGVPRHEINVRLAGALRRMRDTLCPPPPRAPRALTPRERREGRLRDARIWLAKSREGA